MYKVGLYIRVSTEEQAKIKDGSLVSQEHRLKELVKSKNIVHNNWGQVVKVYVEEKSAKDTNRPQYQKMLRDIEGGVVNLILVSELSRLNRNVKDFCELWEFIQKYNTQFMSLRENFDTTTAAGRMMVLSVMNFAQFEREQTGERVAANFHSRAMRGLRSGGNLILGFDRDPHNKGSLVVNKKEQIIVQEIFDTFLKIGAINPTCDALNQKGYRTKVWCTKSGKNKGGKPYVFSTLYALLTHYAYIGKIEVNSKNRYKDQATLPESNQRKIVDAKWKPIISENIFLRVKKILQENNRLFKNKVEGSKMYPYLLTGLVYCAECNELLSGQAATGMNQKFYYYGHNTKKRTTDPEHKKSCFIKRVRSTPLEEAVLARIKQLTKDKTLLLKLVEESNRRSSKTLPKIESLIASCEQQRRKVAYKLESLADRLSELPKEVSGQAIYDKIKILEEEHGQIEAEMKRLREERDGYKTKIIDVRPLFDFIKTINQKLPKLSKHMQRDILKRLISKITILTPFRIRISYFIGPDVEFELDEKQYPVSSCDYRYGASGENRTPMKFPSRDFELYNITPLYLYGEILYT